ncbi:hypothetical protein [Mannheimia varigena]|uniref:hypothetical protein n=1 Tax=Mannheimia varigena TaxID=85404 RepID=UPI0011070E6C|nr:hypothetical protein [Mannheimia varigena]TLU74889.1 hypothetical protein FE589_10100 [Mannheimia varigena]
MITRKKLEHKFELLKMYGLNENGLEESHRIELCLIAINTLIYLDDKRESILPYSFEKFGKSLESYLDRDKHISDDISYLICASFLKEYYLYKMKIDTNDVESSDVYRVWEDFKEFPIPISDKHPIFNNEFYKELKRDDTFLDAIYFCLSMQVSKFNSKNNELEAKKASYIDDLKTEFIYLNRELDENKQALEAVIEDFSHKVEKSYDHVDILSKKLEEQKTAFNFIGLSQGFESLLKKKRNSQSIVLSLLFFIGVFLFIPLFTYIDFYQVRSQRSDLFDWKIFLPFVSIELITVYLFRVVLMHYNSIKTQIMQLELRQTLCQFIQSYADYAKEMKEKDSTSLEKFENLIFSSILSDPEKVPSTFDGLEQLANLIKNIKSGN